MNATPAKPSRINNASRCTHLSAAGSRCRMVCRGEVPGEGSFAGKQVSGSLCAVHAKAGAVRREADDLAATLTGGLYEFTSATPINQFLSRLLLLLAQDRISPRRGAVMAYTANLLLRTLPAIEKETAPTDRKNSRPTIIWNIPGPERERMTIPEQIAAPQTTTGMHQ